MRVTAALELAIFWNMGIEHYYGIGAFPTKVVNRLRKDYPRIFRFLEFEVDDVKTAAPIFTLYLNILQQCRLGVLDSDEIEEFVDELAGNRKANWEADVVDASLKGWSKRVVETIKGLDLARSDADLELPFEGGADVDQNPNSGIDTTHYVGVLRSTLQGEIGRYQKAYRDLSIRDSLSKADAAKILSHGITMMQKWISDHDQLHGTENQVDYDLIRSEFQRTHPGVDWGQWQHDEDLHAKVLNVAIETAIEGDQLPRLVMSSPNNLWSAILRDPQLYVVQLEDLSDLFPQRSTWLSPKEALRIGKRVKDVRIQKSLKEDLLDYDKDLISAKNDEFEGGLTCFGEFLTKAGKANYCVLIASTYD